MKENVLLEKSFAFSLRILKLYLHLTNGRSRFGPAEQVLNSGTSVGANVEEAIGAHSRKDFGAKLRIAYKEARETHYWIRLLRDGGLLEEKLSDSLLQDCDELLKLLGTILKTLNKSD